ncbi:MAG: hypothetical protein GY751_02515 [Bacteroidetes bacterium]|nr:hypothetical protein [Bacteroidota bacterium]
MIWELLKGLEICELDLSEAKRHDSRTRFNQDRNKVYLGADVVPGSGTDARSRMSEIGCLAHELAHAERFSSGLDRDIGLRDEAATSLHASWNIFLNKTQRNLLVEDACNLLDDFLRGDNDEN